MSNSPLVSYTKISPNRNTPREAKIDTITIHCTAGRTSIESLGYWFSRADCKASSNYGIGEDGRIGMYVEEKDRSWCSSNRANDNRAITIECSSDKRAPFAINDNVYKSLINLCVDICKRNGIKRLLWEGDKSLIGRIDRQNMTVHSWFANKDCPGDYIYSRLGQIADEVNARLGVVDEKLYRVQVGAYSERTYAEGTCMRLKEAGVTDYFITMLDNMYKVQVGAFREKENADAMADKLRKVGFDTYVTTRSGTQVSVKKPIDTIAKEVIDGKWGNGDERKERLETAEYDYDTIQQRVNELL